MSLTLEPFDISIDFFHRLFFPQSKSEKSDKMNIRRQHVMVWLLLTVVVMVIQGQQSEERPPDRRYPQSREQQDPDPDEFDRFNENELIERYANKKYNRPLPPRAPPHLGRPIKMPSRMDRINRMGEELRVRMQETLNSDYLRSILSSFSGGDGYSEGGCCEGLDFNTFIPGFVLVAVSYALFFLLNATVTSGRRRRMVTMSKEEEESKLIQISFCCSTKPSDH